MTEKQNTPPSIFDQAFLTGVPEVTELLIIRHGQQVTIADGTLGEAFNPPLSEHGQQQARLLGERLSTLHFDAIITSPLSRARETAEAVARHHRMEPEVVDDLREVELFRDIPRDRTVKDFLGRALRNAVRERMLQERKWDVYPDSESSVEFRKRTVNAIEAIIARNLGERVAIVCHGGVINSYMAHIIGAPYDMFFRPGHTSVNIAAAGGGRRVLRTLNDMHHLYTGEGDFASY
ncbi:MAG: histidine phosphatase family protein [Dehalococcoidia bacterium]